MTATALRFARSAAAAIIVGSLLLAAAGSAIAAPKRAPLAPQVAADAPSPTLHPSGRDRLVEKGGSGTQGKAASDPDGSYNYGIDQLGFPGGLYLVDQDGNNGCGNDQDFEDDNNGNCGRGRTTTPPVTTTPSTGDVGQDTTDTSSFWG